MDLDCVLDWLFLVFSIKYCCPRCQAIEAARGSSAVLRVGKQSKTVKRKYKRPKYLRQPKADAGLGGEQDTTVAVKVPRCSQLFNRGTSVQPCLRQGPTTGRSWAILCSHDACCAVATHAHRGRSTWQASFQNKRPH